MRSSSDANPAPGPDRQTFRDYLMEMFGLYQPSTAADPNADLGRRIETLIAAPTRELMLPPDLMALYERRSGRVNQRKMASWCTTIGLVNLISAMFDFGAMPGALLPMTILFRTIITVMFITCAMMLNKERTAGPAPLLIVPACLITMILAGICGLNAGADALFVIYITMSIIIVYTAITFVQFAQSQAVLLAVTSLLVSGGFVFAAPLPSITEKLQMVLFFTAVMGALLHARRLQTIHSYRVFLLQARDEMRNAEVRKKSENVNATAYTDRLTDVPNRRYFDEIIETLNADPARALPLALCLIDIDHFKNLNDRLGTLQGDQCLRMVATTMRNNLRAKGNILARFSEDSFVLVLMGVEFTLAKNILERIRLAILDLNHPNPGTELGRVSVSIGITMAYNPPLKIESLLQQAEGAIYLAKADGRNRVMYYAIKSAADAPAE
jgi:diguanylate cyclase (GGDEF)-like protein